MFQGQSKQSRMCWQRNFQSLLTQMIKDTKGQAFAADFVFEFSEALHAHSKKTVHAITVASAGYVLSSTFTKHILLSVNDRFKQSTLNKY